MERGKVLDKAKEIINGARQDEYGNPENSFNLIARYWQTYLNARAGSGHIICPLEGKDVAMMMAMFKLARLQGQKYTEDSVVDACGYLALYADMRGE